MQKRHRVVKLPGEIRVQSDIKACADLVSAGDLVVSPRGSLEYDIQLRVRPDRVLLLRMTIPKYYPHKAPKFDILRCQYVPPTTPLPLPTPAATTTTTTTTATATPTPPMKSFPSSSSSTPALLGSAPPGVGSTAYYAGVGGFRAEAGVGVGAGTGAGAGFGGGVRSKARLSAGVSESCLLPGERPHGAGPVSTAPTHVPVPTEEDDLDLDLDFDRATAAAAGGGGGGGGSGGGSGSTAAAPPLFAVRPASPLSLSQPLSAVVSAPPAAQPLHHASPNSPLFSQPLLPSLPLSSSSPLAASSLTPSSTSGAPFGADPTPASASAPASTPVASAPVFAFGDGKDGKPTFGFTSLPASVAPVLFSLPPSFPTSTPGDGGIFGAPPPSATLSPFSSAPCPAPLPVSARRHGAWKFRKADVLDHPTGGGEVEPLGCDPGSVCEAPLEDDFSFPFRCVDWNPTTTLGLLFQAARGEKPGDDDLLLDDDDML